MLLKAIMDEYTGASGVGSGHGPESCMCGTISGDRVAVVCADRPHARLFPERRSQQLHHSPSDHAQQVIRSHTIYPAVQRKANTTPKKKLGNFTSTGINLTYEGVGAGTLSTRPAGRRKQVAGVGCGTRRFSAENQFQLAKSFNILS